ncbi:MAG: hypothetical protein WDO72_11950 [Pseudomonadota bacterium]
MTLKRSAAQYAVLSRLLDEALELDELARLRWLAELSGEHAGERAALTRMLSFDQATSNRRLADLEVSLRSSARGVRALRDLVCDN